VVSSISSVGLSPIFARNTSTFGVSAADHSHRQVKSPETAESPTDSVELSDAYRQRESLSIRARTKLKISKDGEIKAKSQVKLRYKYDFVSADGSKISVRLKANLNFKQTVDGDQYTQSLKLSAKASVKAIQRDVSSATTSLQQAPGIPADIDKTISKALDLFGKLTDAAVGEFVERDRLDGDQLIAGVVDAFNEFAGAVLQSFLLAGEAQPVLPDSVATDIPATPAGDDPVETPVVSSPSTDEPLAPTPDLGTIDLSAPVTEPTTVGDALVEFTSDDTQENSTSVEPTEVVSTVERATGDDHLKASKRTASAVMFKLRLQIVRSLTSLTGKLDPDSGDEAFSLSVFKSSAKLSIRAQGNWVSFDDSSIPRLRFDLFG